MDAESEPSYLSPPVVVGDQQIDHEKTLLSELSSARCLNASFVFGSRRCLGKQISSVSETNPWPLKCWSVKRKDAREPKRLFPINAFRGRDAIPLLPR